MTAVTDPRGKTTTFAYDAQGNRVRQTSPGGYATTFGYDASGRRTWVVEPRGNAPGADPDVYRWTYGYNEADQVVSERSPLGHTASWTHDPAANLASVTDANGRTTSYAYDEANHLVAVTAPDGAQTRYGYDAIGNLTARTDAKGHVTAYAYDAARQLTTITPPAPLAATAYRYDAAGNRTGVTDGAGTTAVAYDALGRPTSINYPSDTPDVTLSYARGNLTSMSDGAGTETRSYDALGRLTSLSRGPDTFSYSYDAASNPTARTYPARAGGVEVRYGYDDDDRLTAVTGHGETTTLAYDAAANLVATTLPAANGHVEQRSYDRDGRAVEVKSVKGTSTIARSALTLDPVGNPTQSRDAADVPTAYTYDSRNRLSRACFGATACEGAANFVGYTYDAVGNRTAESRPQGTTTYAYNAADQLVSQTGLGGDRTYAHDSQGNQVAAGPSRYGYDVAGRLTSALGRESGDYYSATVAPDGPLGHWRLGEAAGTAASDASGNSRAGTYLGLPVLGTAGLVDHDSDTAVGFDGLDDAVALPALPLAETSFSVEAWISPQASSPPTQAVFGQYASPLAGQALALLVHADGRVALSYDSPASPSADSLATAPGTLRFDRTTHLLATYDAGSDVSRIYVDGELRASGGQGPARGAAAAATTGQSGDPAAPRPFKGTIEEVSVYSRALTAEQVAAHHHSGRPATTYAYSGDGRRVAVTDGGKTTAELWDPNHPLPELAAELDGDGGLIRRYVHAAEALSVNSTSATSYYHHDIVGSTLALTGTDGAVQATYAYEPYGLLRDGRQPQPGAPLNRLNFAGEYRDPSGLYHLRARQYDPSLGRFLQPDPVAPAIEDPFVAAYVYANDQPTVLIDPSGECIFGRNPDGSCRGSGLAGPASTFTGIGAGVFGAASLLGCLACAPVALTLSNISTAAAVVATGVECSKDLSSRRCAAAAATTSLSGFGSQTLQGLRLAQKFEAAAVGNLSLLTTAAAASTK